MTGDTSRNPARPGDQGHLLDDLVLGLDHVGIAVADLSAAVTWYREVLGAHCTHEEVNGEQQVAEAMLTLGPSGPVIQLLCAMSPESPIGRFVQRRGPGLQQIAVRVRDIDEALRRLHAAGVHMVDEYPRVGTAGSRIAFIHPRASGGVLVELVEPAPEEPGRVSG
ncbi:MAG: methylmalonyl-CoA epimerase [Actinomycetales bacterium]|nr:methylmalonyl-CoA epimerase [Actinomycetales bacterium]